MRRGTHGNINANFERSIGYLHGRIEKEIEQFAIATGSPFTVIATRISELLHPGGQWSENQMPLLPSHTTGHSSAVATLEMVEHSHHDATPPKRNSKITAYWAKMTPKQRSNEMKKRLGVAKAKAREAKKRATVKVKRKDAITPEQRHIKQKIYQARNYAKSKGLPVPPLPSQAA